MGELLNLVGLSTGVVLYTMLLVMVLDAGRAPGAGPRVDPLLLATALLGLVWNVVALPAHELPKVGFGGPFPLLIAIGFSALGFLPAVVVHSVLRGGRAGVRGPAKRSIVGACVSGRASRHPPSRVPANRALARHQGRAPGASHAPSTRHEARRIGGSFLRRFDTNRPRAPRRFVVLSRSAYLEPDCSADGPQDPRRASLPGHFDAANRGARLRRSAGVSEYRVPCVAYAVSAAAAALHLRSAWGGGAVPVAAAMRLLTYTFVALVVPLAAVTRRQPGARRALWVAALAIFAVSALHLSQFHQGERLVAGRAARPPRVAAARRGDPLPGLSVRARRPLPQAGAGAALLVGWRSRFAAIAAFGAASAGIRRVRAGADPRQVGVLVTLWVATALCTRCCAGGGLVRRRRRAAPSRLRAAAPRWRAASGARRVGRCSDVRRAAAGARRARVARPGRRCGATMAGPSPSAATRTSAAAASRSPPAWPPSRDAAWSSCPRPNRPATRSPSRS